MLITAMRAGLRRGHRITGTAEEGVIKEHGCNAEFRRVELGKDVVSVIGAIIVADASMVAPYAGKPPPVPGLPPVTISM